MYIQSAHLKNIKCFESFSMEFEKGHEAGWHVIIGENGSGKTTTVRALALALTPIETPQFLRVSIKSFPRISKIAGFSGLTKGSVDAIVTRDQELDVLAENQSEEEFYDVGIHIENHPEIWPIPINRRYAESKFYLEGSQKGWFLAGFGPFRRFHKGPNFNELDEDSPKSKAVLTLFIDNVALDAIESWLGKLHTQELEGKNKILQSLILFLNSGQLLPDGTIFTGVDSDGVNFKNPEGISIGLHDLSEGHKSVLSLTLELIRLLVTSFGEEKVFNHINQNEMIIPLPGVVIIDEVDAHLHPTWQTRIGQWFTKYFPKLQFIVTTHSPLICRACGEHGKIFKLAAPGSGNESGEIKDLDRARLVFGDIVEAYETDAFGDDVEWSGEGRKLQREYRDLVYKKRYNVGMTNEESTRFEHLAKLFKSNVEG